MLRAAEALLRINAHTHLGSFADSTPGEKTTYEYLRVVINRRDIIFINSFRGLLTIYVEIKHYSNVI